MANAVWKWWIAVGCVLTAVFLLLPNARVVDVFYLTLALSAPVAIVLGVRRYRPTTRAPWYWMATGEALLFAAETVWIVLAEVAPDQFPSIADGLFLASYPCVAVGLVLLVRERTATRELTSLLDAAVVSIAVGAAGWVFIVQPMVADVAATPLERAVSVAYPLLDLLVLAVVARLALSPGARTPAFVLLTVGLLLNLAADVRYLLEELSGTYLEHGWLDGTWMLAYLLIGASALHPSMRGLTDPQHVPTSTLTPWRLAALTSASIMAPAILLLQWLRGDVSQVPAVSVAAIAMFVLVVLRLSETGRMVDRTRAHGEARFRSLVHNATDVIVVVDGTGVITFVSPAAQRVWGHATSDLLGVGFSTLLHPDDNDRFALAFSAALASDPATPATFEGRIWSPTKRWRSFEAITANLLDDPSVGGVVLTCRDTTERVRLEAQLTHQAFHDPLTGLANRALFVDRVEHAARRAARTGVLVAVLFIDLDDFKAVNDGLGHGAGDALLRDVAQRLAATVPAGDTVARLGGDEFAVLIEDAADRRAVTAIAARLVAAFDHPFVVDGASLAVNASVGIAALDDTRSADMLVRDADIAMYSAKTAGKGRYAWFDQAMRTQAIDRWQLRADLAVARDEAQFFLEFQPIVDLADGRMVGAEALLRWRHPTRGVVPPGEFVPYAEQSGQIVDIGDRVLRAATATAAGWARGRHGPCPYVSVNVSAVQLAEARIVDRIAAALTASGLPAKALVLELTESTLIDNVERSATLLQDLRELGVRVAIDDFGTGYSSLAYLRQFPVDLLKIDRSFVSGLTVEPQSRVLTEDIITLARTLGCRSVAEGIETAEQLAALRAMGCDMGQGFHLGRPMSHDALADMLTRPSPLVARA